MMALLSDLFTNGYALATLIPAQFHSNVLIMMLDKLLRICIWWRIILFVETTYPAYSFDVLYYAQTQHVTVEATNSVSLYYFQGLRFNVYNLDY